MQIAVHTDCTSDKIMVFIVGCQVCALFVLNKTPVTPGCVGDYSASYCYKTQRVKHTALELLKSIFFPLLTEVEL